MTWVALALASAVSWSVADLFAKRAVEHAPVVVVAWFRVAFSLPLLLGALWLWGWRTPGPRFWPAALAALPLEVAATLLYQRALQISPLGLTAPYLAFTPAFLVLTGWWILGEVPGPAAGAGIALVCLGGYLLQLEPGMGPVGPFRALVRERGSLLMLLVAAIYSLTAALGKVAVLASNPQTFAAVYYAGVAAALTPLARPARAAGGRARLRYLVPVGAAMAVMILTHLAAIRIAPASYMIAVKRTNLLWSIVLGHVFLGERNLGGRLLGGAAMMAGVLMVAWLG